MVEYGIIRAIMVGLADMTYEGPNWPLIGQVSDRTAQSSDQVEGLERSRQNVSDRQTSVQERPSLVVITQ